MLPLSTARLRLEELTVDDADFMLHLLNDPAYIANIRDRGIRTREAAGEFIRDSILASYRDHGFGMYAIRIHSDSSCIGICGLVSRPGREDVDIGYALLPAYRGQGYTLEAARAVMELARGPLGFSRLVGVTARENTASVAVLKKLGMHFEQQIRLADDEEPIDQYVWEAAAAGG